MKDKIFFSVICPIYNAEKTLSFSVESIFKQSYKNWELVLIDDGSSDSSGQICDQLAKRDNRIKVIHKKNEGQAKARIDGITITEGDYLLFLDSDDYYEPNALEILNSKLVSSNLVDLIVYNAKKVLNNSSIKLYDLSSSNFDSPMIECFCKRRISYFWTLCVKKELFTDIDENVRKTFCRLRYSEDLYLIYNIVKEVQKDKFLIIDEELYRYVSNPFSITNTQTASKLMDRFFVFDYVYKDIYKNYPELFVNIATSEKDSAGWTGLSAARRVALEYHGDEYYSSIKRIRKSFLFNHFNKFKKDKYNTVAYILLKLKMYSCFRKYIIKHER